MQKLATVLHHAKKFKDSEAVHRQILELAEDWLGKDNPDAIECSNLVQALASQGTHKDVAGDTILIG